MHGILMAPHGTGDAVIGLAALVQVSATLPQNYIAFEYPVGNPQWWYDIVDGLPGAIVKDGFIDVWRRPGMGVDLVPEEPKKDLSDEDADLFNRVSSVADTLEIKRSNIAGRYFDSELIFWENFSRTLSTLGRMTIWQYMLSGFSK